MGFSVPKNALQGTLATHILKRKLNKCKMLLASTVLHGFGFPNFLGQIGRKDVDFVSTFACPGFQIGNKNYIDKYCHAND